MVERRRVEISSVVIRQGDTFPMQLRRVAAHVGAPGMIGFFGGKLEQGESAIQAGSRELAEETTLQLDADRFRLLDTIEVDMNIADEPVHIIANIIETTIAADVTFEATDGQLVSLSEADMTARSQELTPVTWAAYQKLLS